MKHSLKTGLGFGITSGITTILGLIVGLNAGTYSRLAILGGILTIAIADSFSDALGVHVAKEFENKNSTREIWESTIATLLSKFFMAILFAIPIFIFPLAFAIKFDLFLGLILLGTFSYVIARERKVKPFHVIGEHLLIATFVIVASQLVGTLVRYALT